VRCVRSRGSRERALNISLGPSGADAGHALALSLATGAPTRRSCRRRFEVHALSGTGSLAARAGAGPRRAGLTWGARDAAGPTVPIIGRQNDACGATRSGRGRRPPHSGRWNRPAKLHTPGRNRHGLPDRQLCSRRPPGAPHDPGDSHKRYTGRSSPHRRFVRTNRNWSHRRNVHTQRCPRIVLVPAGG
jgi:hypothetical protein